MGCGCKKKKTQTTVQESNNTQQTQNTTDPVIAKVEAVKEN